MTTTIQVRSDNPEDADLIARDIGDHLAGSGFKLVLVTTMESGDGLIKSDRQKALQSQHDTVLEMTNNPSLLDAIRRERPEFFATEEIEVMAVPWDYIEDNSGARREDKSMLIERNLNALTNAICNLDRAFSIVEKAAEGIKRVTAAAGRPLTPEERLAAFARSEGLANIEVSTF